VIDANHGYEFCQQLTDAVHRTYPDRLQIAEFWGHRDAALQQTQSGGFGFDAVVDDGLRDAVRTIVSEAAGGGGAGVNLARLDEALSAPQNAEPWRLVTQLETEYVHDTFLGRRLAAIADPANSSSWYARSRARVATGLLLTARGTPLIFMGQEILEDKQWSDDSAHHRERLIAWNRLESDKSAVDFHRFIRELIKVRRASLPLRGELVRVFHVANENRVLAFYRGHAQSSDEVVVVISLKETPFPSYSLGFPSAGVWTELFNSDLFDNWPNPQAVSNPSGVSTIGPGMHGFSQSATIAIPANGIQIFLKRSNSAAAPA
jgi:1,4-alpha-glucan branching enzyme